MLVSQQIVMSTLQIAQEIHPTLLDLYPGLPLACLLVKRGASYNDKNLPRNICQVLSEHVKQSVVHTALFA